MVRVNVDCLVDAKKEYLGHFVAKVSPAFHAALRALVEDAKLLASDAPPATVADMLEKLLGEVPQWNADLVQAEIVDRLRAHCPSYMTLYRKVYVANGIILNTVHSSNRRSKVPLDLPSEEIVARNLWRDVALEFAGNAKALLGNPREVVNALHDAIQESILRNIPVDQIVESSSESEEEEKFEQREVAADSEPEPAEEADDEPGVDEAAFDDDAEVDVETEITDTVAENLSLKKDAEQPAAEAKPEDSSDEGVKRIVIADGDW